jgi:hypothetical protein
MDKGSFSIRSFVQKTVYPRPYLHLVGALCLGHELDPNRNVFGSILRTDTWADGRS